ncbi:Insect cuticle protein [Nesidiocoris tenuis]|uniref:Insect cuticle protein n=1 Tax=Nesidiocoris tenuis TaxID=355587 RepID=A0ABN7B589_9HEMI|nr:Insect cuticle protein [Nesidiocoris tenuis]
MYLILGFALASMASAAEKPVFGARFARAPQYVASSAPLSPVRQPIAILSQNSNSNYDGNFNYDFQAENGIVEQAVGSIKVLDPETQAQVMQGRYAYTAPDGTPIEASWYADETGFHIEGAHLPTPPPIPDAIARSLEYLRSLPPAKEDQYEQTSNKRVYKQ